MSRKVESLRALSSKCHLACVHVVEKGAEAKLCSCFFGKNNRGKENRSKHLGKRRDRYGAFPTAQHGRIAPVTLSAMALDHVQVDFESQKYLPIQNSFTDV